MIHVDLNDKYDLTKDRIFLTGTQALVRLCLLRAQIDKRAGLDTAGYVSGYRGSPLGGLDQQFSRAKAQLDACNVVFEAGLNEDLAATAIWGTQQAELRGEGRHDGVFGLWYGKGPGVDRSGDAFRHANLAGTSPHGGVLVLMGDDHTCESSTTSHQSEFALVDAMIPILNPSNIDDMLSFGLHGWTLSRYAGVWCGLKCVKDNVESSGVVDAGPDRYQQVLPTDHSLPEGGLNIRLGDTPQVQEARLHQHKLDAVRAYARANGLDRTVLGGGEAPRIGIVSTGKSYMDTVQALEELEIDAARADALGLALYKVGMSWPMEPEGLQAFAEGLDLIVVVEEKRGLMEDQIRSILYGRTDAPVVIGKKDEAGATLFQSEAALNPVQIAAAIGSRVARLTGDAALTRRSNELTGRIGEELAALSVARRPYFCAGCPHNSSTVVPEGSRAYAGIGCHYLAQFMGRETSGYTHMGAEGANWIGEGKFSTRAHVFQNIGDGTYNHSGLMAIRAAIGSGANMTYKILYNDAVAMTGGQGHDGGIDVYRIAAEVAGAGVTALKFVTDDVSRIDTSRLPAGVSVHDRAALQEVQRELAGVKGVSALIYDQTCAAEKRRRRKRGTFPDPARRVFINDAVCEGCGDCGVQSNCVAIVPKQTPLGTKRQIDQSACNKDFSCLKGFCPSFVTVEGGTLKKPDLPEVAVGDLPEPHMRAALDPSYAIALTGVGGTGVVTVGAILGMAAHLDGLGCGIIDMAGLAQKGGAVVSHIKIAKDPADIHAIRIARGGADLVLGCDMVTAAGPDMLATLSDNAHAVINAHEMMTGDFALDRDFTLPVNLMYTRIEAAVPDGNAVFVNATRIALRLFGDSIAGNLFLLGVAFQRGLIPVSGAAIDRAVEMNGVAVSAGKAAFAAGRGWVVDPSSIGDDAEGAAPEAPSLDAQIADRETLLQAYQGKRYARGYSRLVAAVRAVDPDPALTLTGAVVRNAAKLMAYKDEYEVARLYARTGFLAGTAARFEGDVRLNFHLAPPVFSRTDPATGRPKKRVFGPWVQTVFAALAKLKGLRGTPFDLFGYSAERRAERGLVRDYKALVAELVRDIETVDYDTAVALAELPDGIRGYGPVKMEAIAIADAARKTLMTELKQVKTVADVA